MSKDLLPNQTSDSQNINITDVLSFKIEKMHRISEVGSLKAFIDIAINDAIIIRGIRILEGKKGLFVSMPQGQGKDNKWYDKVLFKTTGLFELFSYAVLEHYRIGRD